MKMRATGLSAFAAVWLLASCAPASDEAQIKDFLKKAAVQAEKKDLDGLLTRLASDYRDFEGRDKAATATFIGDHVRQTRGILVRFLSARLDSLGADGTALVRGEILVSSGASEVLRKLIRFSGEYYRLDLRLRRDNPGHWLISFARWESIPVTDLFPESMGLLKKLFPGF